MIKKIAIIGCAGSGKTTLSLELQKKITLPLYHLDQYYWKPGWQRSELCDFIERHNILCDQDTWIIEGLYKSTFYYRAMQADVIIFLDVPRYVYFWRILKRAVLHHGSILPGSPAGCKQRIFSWSFIEFLLWAWRFKREYRPFFYTILNVFSEEKKIYILRTKDDIKKLINDLC